MARLWRDSRLKRALCGGVLLLYLVASLGLLPSPDLLSRWFGYAISEPFPCQSHSCGCATAHQCWTSCCCYTPHQRLVWAGRNGVEPPPSARYSQAEWAAAALDAASDAASGARALVGQAESILSDTTPMTSVSQLASGTSQLNTGAAALKAQLVDKSSKKIKPPVDPAQ